MYSTITRSVEGIHRARRLCGTDILVCGQNSLLAHAQIHEEHSLLANTQVYEEDSLLENKQVQTQSPLCGMPESLSFKIMSPDGQTDWTLAVWHVHLETKSTLEFTEDILEKMEVELAT